MKIYKLSDKFEDDGAVILPTKEKSFFDLNVDKLRKIFYERGIILFKRFNIKKTQITKITDIFTEQYANDAKRRKNRYKNKKLHDVDPGNYEMPLHSEASYSPAWPEIVWFYCNKAPKKSGQTTLCDGVAIHKNFSLKLKNFFLKNQIVYKAKIPFKRIDKDNKKNLKKKIIKAWYIECPGIENSFINLNDGYVQFSLKRYGSVKIRKANKVAFVNHLQIILDRDPQLLSISLENGKKIPQTILREVKKISDDLTINLNWDDGDLCMIDNQRFMHGRRSIDQGEKRDIMNVQTLKAKMYS